jgi:hypothetical protein
MTAPTITHFWASLLGSAARLAIILTGLGLMIGLVKQAELPRKLGTILGLVVALTILPGIFITAWARMSLWQQLALTVIGIGILLCLRPHRRPRRNRMEKRG